jgi:hypothetical protein
MSETGLMVVPVRSGAGTVSLRCGRLPGGERVGIAFTTEAALTAVMGPDQPSIHLHERALRSMLAPLGVTRLQVNPGVVAEVSAPAGAAIPVAV